MLAIGAVSALALASGAAYASGGIPDGAGVFHGCYNTDNGNMRLQLAGTSCKNDELPVSWSQTGPGGARGAQGPAGAQGPQGPRGFTGTAGTTGAQGPQGIQGPAGPQGDAAPADPTYMHELFSSTPGPLPLSTTYTSQGGSILFMLSGTGWSTINYQTIGVNLLVDGHVVGTAKTSLNEPYSHKTFASNAIVMNNLPAGTHSIRLTQFNNTGQQEDANDYFDLAVIEVVPGTGGSA